MKLYQMVLLCGVVLCTGLSDTGFSADLEAKQADSLKGISTAAVSFEEQTHALRITQEYQQRITTIVQDQLARASVQADPASSQAQIAMQLLAIRAGQTQGVYLIKVSVRQSVHADRNMSLGFQAETWHKSELVICKNDLVLEEVERSISRLATSLAADFNIANGKSPAPAPVIAPLSPERLGRMSTRLKEILDKRLEATPFRVKECKLSVANQKLVYKVTIAGRVLNAEIQSSSNGEIVLPMNLQITDQEICASGEILTNLPANVKLCVKLQELL